MVHACLWGNASDLSFALQGDASVLQAKAYQKDADKYILIVCFPTSEARLMRLFRTTWILLGKLFRDFAELESISSSTTRGSSYMPI
jgi:hypothetical protein